MKFANICQDVNQKLKFKKNVKEATEKSFKNSNLFI